MRRVMFVFLSLTAFVWTTGCGITSNGGTGGLPTPNALSGQYAILLSGFDSTANPMGIVGSIKADGLGNITTGELDVNDNGTISSSSAVTGTYAFDPTGRLGVITLSNNVGSVPHPFVFGFSLQTSGILGQIMDLSANNFIAAGTMQQQDSTVFSLSKMAGDYTAALNGWYSSIRISALGRFTLTSSGVTSNVEFDRSGAGVGTFGPTIGASTSLTFTGTGPDANGRGTLYLNLSDGLASSQGFTYQGFTYYAVNANRIVALETDTTGSMIADFSSQSTPFTAATVATPGSVFGMSGLDRGGNEIAAVGQMQITPSPNIGNIRWDSNDNGTIVGPVNVPSQPVAFDPTTGRGTITILGGASNGLADSAVFYLAAPGTGFIMDTTPSVSNRAMAGPLTAQATGTFSASNDLGGQGIVRSRGSAVTNASSLVGVFGLTSTPAQYSLFYNARLANGSIQTLSDTSAPTISLLTLDSSAGRGTLSFPTFTISTATKVFYLIGPNQFMYIDISPILSGLNGASPLSFVSPQ
jgi:hypothetical protein